MQQQSLGDDGSGGTSLPGAYRSLWNDPIMRLIRRVIVVVSVFMLFVIALVVVMFVFRLIPAIPPSFLYYGFLWYLLFLFTGVVTLFMAFTPKYALNLITFIILLVAVIAITILNFIIGNQLVQCFLGNLDANCADFRLTQIVLFILSLTIGFCIFILFGLYLVIVVRLTQTHARSNGYNNNNQY